MPRSENNLPLITNEIHLIPFFDGGGDILNSPVVAEVDKIFKLRGAGLIVAYRIQVRIRIRVVLIIGFNYNYNFGYGGFYNEFPEFGGGIGSIVIDIEVYVSVTFILSFLMALVKPSGELKVLAQFNLTAGFNFQIGTNGNNDFHFQQTRYRARVIGINPMPNNLMPCSGKFQLLSDNWQTSFLDSTGGYESFYFVREAGECCIPWNFNMQLSRFSSTGQEEILQDSFQTTYCLAANESPARYAVIITSEPPPTGLPPTLEMDIGDTATLKALAVPVDSNGTPTGAPPQDLRDLDYGVDFFLENQADHVLDPTTLPPGEANAIIEGNNLIRAAVTSVRVLDDVPALSFWKDSVFGFRRGETPSEQPKLVVGGLPVSVNSNASAIKVEPILAYEETVGGITTLVVAPKQSNVLSIPTETWEMVRNEPFETQREYFLAVKVNVPAGVVLPNDTKLTFRIDRAMSLELFKPTDTISRMGYPLSEFSGNSNRSSNKPEDFFTGNLLVSSSAPPLTNRKITLTLPNGTIPPDTIIKIVEGTDSMKLQPNVKESNISGASKKLVPPGTNVTGKNVLLKIPMNCTANNGVTVSFPKSFLNIVPTNNETFEEYLRVFEQVQTILSDAGLYFRDFAKELLNSLNLILNPATNASAVEDELKKQGGLLWKKAWELVNTGYLDDRPLYWARLQGIGAIKAFAKNKGFTIDDAKLNKFEWTSRGLEADGTIKFPTTIPTGKRRAIITGFDPFDLYAGLSSPTGPDYCETSNPSGLLALRFNEQPVDVANQEIVYVKSAVFPVRYNDFNKGIVENAVSSSLGSIIMLITMSENGSLNYYDLERWAARNRSDRIDNNYRKGTSDVSHPPIIPSGSEFLESTLPLAKVIVSSEVLDSPNGTSPFVIDQSYLSTGSIETNRSIRRTIPPASTPPVIEIGKYRPEPVLNDFDGHFMTTDIPVGTSIAGLGGDYLSNEIFYRVAIKRNSIRNSLASGHFHVPSTNFKPRDAAVGGRLVLGVTKALSRLFEHGFRLSTSATSIDFPDVYIYWTPEQMLTITNNSTEILKIGSIDTTVPFSVVLTSANPLPLTINPGASLTIPVRFSPTVVGAETAKLTFKESSGEILLIVDLTGECVQNLPPVISGFIPRTAYFGDSVTISGQNFTEATDVQIGGISVNYEVINDNQILAYVEDTGGFIKVFTPSDNVTSTNTLFVRPPRNGGDI